MTDTPETSTVAAGPVVQRNPAQAAAPPPPPEHPGGRSWRFEMIYGGGSWRAYADTPAELVEALIPGYAQMIQPTVRAQARLTLACMVQVHWQAEIAARFSLDGCTPEQRDILLGDFSTPPVVAYWDAPLPLVLVATFYIPYRSTPAPEGNVLWLDPSGDWDLLITLAEAGAINLHVLEEEFPPDAPPDLEEGSDDGRR